MSTPELHQRSNNLRVRCLDLDTLDKPIALLRKDSPVCRSEGFDAHARVRLESLHDTVIATLFQTGSELLAPDEIGLSTAAWRALQVRDGQQIHVSHPKPLESISSVRGKVYGRALRACEFGAIMRDVVHGRYDDIQLAMLLTAIAARALDDDELFGLTDAMVGVGERLDWDVPMRLDKHCVGGLPGNRTTPLIVAIVAANGLVIPKTSSRAITSPAGTADTMETLAPVSLTLGHMQRVVEREGGCVVWGGSVGLSPVDDLLIRVARVMDLDAEAQLVASVLSKKVAAGSTHLVLDLPVGATAKLRSREDAERLGERLRSTAARFDLTAEIVISDGRQPVGRGIGPALEARDLLAVFQGDPDAPRDLADRALSLAGVLLEFGGKAEPGDGVRQAARTLESGAAWQKFQAICEAQGGLREPPKASRTEVVTAAHSGCVTHFDNRRLSRVAKLAGAPGAPAAGLELHVHLGDEVRAGDPLYTIHAETAGELGYAREFAGNNGDIIQTEADR
ncbi:thymidine phosphorylase family protein [Wenzhouxiangella sp. XN79A]|uniref:thymidine phosphorylase family protein n=1 Tax=Wenzhouxiangella sp. XN79A TaxID=2724193 RepID=UPI00144AE467|nr:thymidine phosphorylase family protein [Wenzhouxiangella sp. XN79A]NKI33836.1 thymidine phosphorylase family protein [Wenzhouxiangella sp. XN79A]